MLFVKLLLLVVGGGTVAGVTYTQVKKPDTEKTIVVSNNQEAKIRARLEKQMDIDLLKDKKNYLNERKTQSDTYVKTKQNELEISKANLLQSQKDLNESKTELNNISVTLISEYGKLTTKDGELQTALTTKMSDELTTNEKTLKKEFYKAQQATYNKEKEAIVAKINAIYPTSNVENNTICSGSSANWPQTSTPPPPTKTPAEIEIDNAITQELTAICSGLDSATNNISTNNTTASTSNDYSTKKSERDSVVDTINSETNKYNLQIIKIKSKESDLQIKLLQFRHKEQAYLDAQSNNKKIQNELERVEETITQNT